MSRMVQCVLLKREAPGLERVPYPGELGRRIYESVSREGWARWLAIAWIAFHLVISIFHTKQGILVHAVVLIAFCVLLFLPAANRYFLARA